MIVQFVSTNCSKVMHYFHQIHFLLKKIMAIFGRKKNALFCKVTETLSFQIDLHKCYIWYSYLLTNSGQKETAVLFTIRKPSHNFWILSSRSFLFFLRKNLHSFLNQISCIQASHTHALCVKKIIDLAKKLK